VASFSTVQTGDNAVSSNINQFAEALGGQANIPISVTGVNDASLWALDVKNADVTNARSFRAQDSSGNGRFTVGNTSTAYVQADPDGGGLRPVVVQTGSTFSLLAASSNTVRVPQVRVNNASTQTLANNTNVVLNWDTEVFDNDNCHSTASNSSRFVPSRAGLWQIGACIEFDAVSSGTRAVQLMVNSSYVAIQQGAASPAGPQNTILQLSVPYQLSTTDAVTVSAFQNSGASIGVSTSAHCAFWMFYLGAT
jgi:hypothetical protein